MTFFSVPIFDEDLKVTSKKGKIKANFWISDLGKLEKFEIVSITPEELPREIIEKSIRESRFAVAKGNSVDGQEIEIIFEIKKKERFEISMPKVEPVKIEFN